MIPTRTRSSNEIGAADEHNTRVPAATSKYRARTRMSQGSTSKRKENQPLRSWRSGHVVIDIS
jgi:hypothetical protein